MRIRRGTQRLLLPSMSIAPRHLAKRLSQRRPKRIILIGSILLTAVLLPTLVAGFFLRPHTAVARAARAMQNTVAPLSPESLQILFFVWASGTPAVQQAAAHDCSTLHLSPQQCAGVSAAVRAAWLDLASRDPASVGQLGVPPNLTGRAQALLSLHQQLTTITAGHIAALLTTTTATAAQISQPQWIEMHVLPAMSHGRAGPTGQTLPAGTALVWATSYLQRSLPNGLSPKRSPYAALPDAYLKFANWGTLGNIPALYQPFYAPAGVKTHWSVTIATANGGRSVANVLITDVGPWNEDDNWWDPNGASTTLPANCPVSGTLIAPDATTNALVNGICPSASGPTGVNQRRIYYYLLYQHDGLPFFQPGGYAPSGNFADGTAWPTPLAQYCSEASAASTSNDGIACFSGSSPYNASHGGWLRSGAYDGPILNQASIDVSPAVDKALGWVYPSSGLVQVTVSSLP